MLRVLGSPKKLCSGPTRRDMLQVGALGFFGLGLHDFLRLSTVQAAAPQKERHFGKAKACILLHLYGSPSQIETVDMKPAAPPEIRGEFKSIRSSLPGLDVCELLPNLARAMDRTTVVRSMTHPYPIHGVAYALTGVPQIDIPMELNPHDGRHWPFVGSVVDYVLRGRDGGKPTRPVPDNLALPFAFSSQRVGEVPRAGPYAAFLGSAYNPIWTEFHGKASKKAVKTLQEQRFEAGEPYRGVTPDSRFALATATHLAADMTLDRLNRRQSLTQQFDRARRDLDRSTAGQSLDRFRQMALSLVGSDRIREALDLGREPLALRETYGMTLFGQSCLAARRLVEAGSRFVTVFWDEYGLAGSGWDTHWDHYPRMKDELLPGLDRAWYGLIADLDARGLLEETLVLCVSEHGRTPKMQNVKGGGRDHWSQAYSCLFAGGGVARGNIVGKTDKIGGTVAERPVSPKDILATLYHLLGIDHMMTLVDRVGRPLPLVEGSVVQEMLA
ncbi:MAG: DUF1501 domain-containing protein [Planctomycetota bacterium]|nr:MAG: DUF1501 domain-containing protein [Planctomycetota bacterium]